MYPKKKSANDCSSMMTKRSYREMAQPEKDNVGCMSGLARMFSFHRDRKLLLDRKNECRRHVASGYSRTKLSQFVEMDMEDNSKDECKAEGMVLGLPTIKTLMEEEMGKGLPLQKNAKEIRDFGCDVHLHKNRGHTSGKSTELSDWCFDSTGSRNLNSTEGNDLELVLATFLVEIFRYHSECKHVDCKTKTGLCPALKSIIQMKLDDLNNPNSYVVGEHVSSRKAAQSKGFMNALEILSSNKEYFLKLLRDPNSRIWERIQILCNRNRGSNFAEEMGIQEQSREFSFGKTFGKQNRHSFFWRKDKANTRQTSEGINGSRAVSRIVVLKPNSTFEALDNGERTATHFMSEIKRRLKFFVGEKRRERSLVPIPKDGHRKSPFWLKDSIVADERVFRESSVTSLAGETLLDRCTSFESSASDKQMKSDGFEADTRGDNSISVGESFLYEEAQKHLTEAMNDGNGDQSVNFLTGEISRLSTRMASFEEQDAMEGLSLSMENLENDECGISIGEDKHILNSETKIIEVGCREGDRADQIGTREFRDGEDVACVESSCYSDECPETFNIGSQIDERFNSDLMPDLMPDSREESEPRKESLQFSFFSSMDFTERPEQLSQVTIQEPCAASSFPSSPGRTTEKPEQPSPVSVIEPFFSNDIAHPVCKTTTNIEIPIESSEAHFDEHGKSSPPRKITSDVGPTHEYVKSVLVVSGLISNNYLERWYLADQLLDPSLFSEVEAPCTQTDDDSRLLFDCISEVLMEIKERDFRYEHDARPPPTGINIVREVCMGIDCRLYKQFPSTLEQLLEKDLLDGGTTWMRRRSESDHVVIEVWDDILDDLFEEAVFDLWLDD